MNLEQHIEALLFWKGEPLTIKELSKLLGKEQEEIRGAVHNLQAHLLNRGIILMKTGSVESKDEEVMLGTSPEASELIEKITKDELQKDLGKAALETLSVILYKGPVKRSEIDYIRGVNSTFILRNLLIRGLIEKKPAPNDQRASVYSASFELLSHLGVAEIKDLPNFELVQQELKNFELHKEEGVGQDKEQDTEGNSTQEHIEENTESEESLESDTTENQTTHAY